MKAVVVELNNTKAAVLSDDGCITTIRNNNYEIGQVIQLNQPKVSMIKKITVCAASAAAVIFISAGTWAYASPYSYVSMDVNPSIEFSVNRFDRVIKVKAVNDDGEEILNQISLDDLRNQTIANAITTTVKEISEAGYFDGETEDGIVIATSSEDMEKAEELAQELQKSVEEETSGNGDVVIVDSISVDMERVDEAKSLGVTPGKLGLVEKLQEAADDPSSISLEEWLGKPVKDIMKATKEYTKAATVQEDAEASEVNPNDDIDENDSSTVQNNDETTDNQINEDKALKQAEKDAEKAKKEAAKAEKKAKEAKEKADKKAKEAAIAEDAKANNTGKDAAGQSITKAQEAKEAAKEAQKAAEEARKEAEKARKEAEKAQKEVEKAQKEAEKAGKKAEKNIESNNDSKKNDTNTIDNEDNSKESSSDNIIDQNYNKEDINQDQTDLDSTEAPNKEKGNSGNSDKGKN